MAHCTIAASNIASLAAMVVAVAYNEIGGAFKTINDELRGEPDMNVGRKLVRRLAH